METRANHLLIGAFTILGVLGAFGFFVWLAEVQVDRRFAYYEIVFESVSGLGRASDVRFSGLSVGRVVSLELYPEDPSKVAVRVEVAAETPIKADTRARLQAQGLTGVAFVALSGGSRDAPLLRSEDQADPPTLFAERSVVQSLLDEAPDLMLELTGLVRSLSEIASPDNRARFADVLENLDAGVAGLAGLAETADATLATAGAAFARVDAAALRVGRTMAAADGVLAAADETFAVARRRLDEDLGPVLGDLMSATRRLDAMMERAEADLPAVIGDMRSALARTDDAAARLDAAIAASAPHVRAFAAEGLPQYAKLARETRELVDTLRRLAARIERDPARFFFGDRPPEFRR